MFVTYIRFVQSWQDRAHGIPCSPATLPHNSLLAVELYIAFNRLCLVRDKHLAIFPSVYCEYADGRPLSDEQFNRLQSEVTKREGNPL